jgi:hypothetical protein
MEFGDINEQLEKKEVETDEKHADFIRVASLAIPEIPLLVGAMIALVIGSLTSLAVPYYFGEVLFSFLSFDINRIVR